MMSVSLQSCLDELVQFGGRDDRKADLIEAKVHFFTLTGEVFEDDRQFEFRMALFLDWYLMDRRQPLTRKTPAQELYCGLLGARESEKAQSFRGFTESHHSIFEWLRSRKSVVELRDIVTDETYTVTERRELRGIDKGDLIDARLIPFGNELFFSSAMGFHPHRAIPNIKKEAARIRKELRLEASTQFAFSCAKKSLKADRYRQIPIDRIYDFSSER